MTETASKEGNWNQFISTLDDLIRCYEVQKQDLMIVEVSLGCVSLYGYLLAYHNFNFQPHRYPLNLPLDAIEMHQGISREGKDGNFHCIS